MPHFIVDCAESILSVHDGDAIIERVHAAASASGLFAESNVQVRLNIFKHYRVGNKEQEFIQVFANILEGRTIEQKLDLSTRVVTALSELFPGLATIGIDIIDLEKGAGFNKSML